MGEQVLTIKQLTDAVGSGITPRMVRHYHQLGLLPPAERSRGNYRLYDEVDVQRLKRIVALKQQGFQLSHVQKILEVNSADAAQTLTNQLQQQYRSIVQQLAHLRQTASALESLLAGDRHCQELQAEAIAGLKLLEVETQDGLGELEKLWNGLNASAYNHPEQFEESLQQLLPDLANSSEIEVDLISKLVLACGDVSLVNFLRLSKDAIAVARHSLSNECHIVGDVPAVVAALDKTRLAHLKCEVATLINDPHITSAVEAEQAFWHQHQWGDHLQQVSSQSILVVGYAPSILMSACAAIEQGQIQPALIIGMPIGFSHAPVAKKRLMHSGVPYITIEGSLGGGLLAAVALNALVESLLEKPDCHCYLEALDNSSNLE